MTCSINRVIERELLHHSTKYLNSHKLAWFHTGSSNTGFPNPASLSGVYWSY